MALFPTFYEHGGIALHSWGLMVTLAFVAAFVVAHLRAPRVGVDPDRLVPLYLVLTVSGMVGARLLHFVFAEPGVLSADPLAFFSPDRGGWAFYGGAIGGTLGGVAYAAAKKLPVLKLADVLSPTIMLGYAIGRIGCLLAGCCHGGLCPAPVRGTLLSLPHGDILSVQGAPFVALLFEPGVGVGSLRGQVLFPSQLLEIGTGLLLFGLLSLAWARWRRFDGQILAMLLVFYALARSFAEQFRGDAVRGLHAVGPVTLSTSQLVSGGMVVLAAVLVALLARRGVAPEQPFVPPDPDAVLPEPRGPGGR